MKVGIVCHPSIGGSGLVATQLGIGLAKRGHEVHFIASNIPFKLQGLQELEQHIYYHRVEAIHYPLFDDKLTTFALTAKIVEVAETFQLDLIHAHYSIPHSLCCYLAQQISRHRFPFITTIHGTDVTIVGRDKPLYPLNKFSIQHSNSVTTVSHFQAQYIKQHFDIQSPIDVIYNFIDDQVFSPKNRSINQRALMAKPDEKVVLHISNFRPVKNTEGVLRSFALMNQQINAKLVLLGDGPEIARVQTLANQLGVEKSVNFMGKVFDVEKYIANADVVFQPSYHESFGMVALEAMCSEVPVVSSSVDGIPEVVTHNETGLLAHPDDHLAHCEHLTHLLEHGNIKHQMGQKGRRVVKEKFSWQRQIRQYENYYTRVINNLMEQSQVS